MVRVMPAIHPGRIYSRIVLARSFIRKARGDKLERATGLVVRCADPISDAPSRATWKIGHAEKGEQSTEDQSWPVMYVEDMMQPKTAGYLPCWTPLLSEQDS